MRRSLFPLGGVLVIVFVASTRENGLPHGFHHRMMGLEFAQSADDVDAFAGKEGSDQRSVTRKNLGFDTSVVVPAYWIYFISIAAFMYAAESQERQRRKNARVPVPGEKQGPEKPHPLNALWIIGIPLAISVTAVADLVENFASLATLDGRPVLQAIHIAGYTKWGSLGLTCLLVGVGLVGKRMRTLPAALAYLAVAVLMGWALWTNLPRVEIAFLMLGFAVAFTGEAASSLSQIVPGKAQAQPELKSASPSLAGSSIMNADPERLRNKSVARGQSG